MNSNSWATIKSVSNAGKGANYWAVGDTKNIKINGKVGNFTFSNLSIDVFILGFFAAYCRSSTLRCYSGWYSY